jgi:hypothetical protein
VLLLLLPVAVVVVVPQLLQPLSLSSDGGVAVFQTT